MAKAKQIDWSYHRNGCKTCARAQEFLVKYKIEQANVVDARKNKMGIKDALKMAHSMEKLYIAKGDKVVSIDMTEDKPSNKALQSLLIGPTGNLRAPTLLVGKTLLVGFNSEAFSEVLCS